MANATRYFDLTPAANGFGLLTGAWDTTAANWTASSTGAAGTNVAYTFDNTDTAAFGSATTAPTGGTATISTGINVTLNQIVTANIAALQTIAAAGTGKLTLAGTTPTITVNSAGGLTISSPLEGSSGFTRTGSGGAGAVFSITSNNNTNLTGTVTLNAASGVLNNRIGALATAGTPNGLSGISSFAFTNTSANIVYLTYAGLSSYTEDASFTSDGATGSQSAKNAQVWAGNGAGVTFTPAISGGISNFTGSFYLYTSTSPNTASIVFNEFPTSASVFGTSFDGALNTVETFAFATGGTTNALVLFDPVTNPSTLALKNSAGSASVVLAGNITKSSAVSGTLQLSGAGTNGTISGAIANSAGTLALTKIEAGRWVLSGANTYTGVTTISAGTLVGNSTSAFGASTGTTSVVTQTGGTLEFGAVVNKGTNGVTLNSVGGADAVSAPTGTTGLSCAGVALSAASTIFNIAGGTFTLTNTAAMSGGGFGLTKTGVGEMVVASTVANTYTGATTVSAGTLAIQGAVSASVNGPLGNAASGIALTGTLKYAGTGSATISRSLTLTGAAPALEAEGTTSAAPVTFSAFTHAAGARTLTLKGANTGNNTFSAVLNDNGASVVSLTKTGASKWIISAQPTYTGLTTVSEGELQFNELNLSNNLTINGTGKLSKTVLNGSSKTITCDGGTPEIEATTSANTVTGTTSVTGGTLRLTTEVQASGAPVKVLGGTNVAVSSGAAIRTTTGNLQRGQMRYGGNLTLNANSTLYVGG